MPSVQLPEPCTFPAIAQDGDSLVLPNSNLALIKNQRKSIELVKLARQFRKIREGEMGGSRSGRYGGRPTAEGCGSHILTTRFLHQCKVRHGQLFTAAAAQDQSFQVAFTLDTRDPNYSFIEVEHEPYTDYEGTVRYIVRLVTTRPPFGGLRWWFICPSTGQRVSKLFLPRGGRKFLSRQAYRLGYACQRVTPLERRQRRIARLIRTLGGEGRYGEEIPEKRKWMRWATYDALVAEIDRLETVLDRSWAARAAWLVSRL
jgi:hypothetical protein